MPHSGRLLPEVAFLCHRLHVVPLGEAPCQVWVLLLHEDLLTPISIDRGRCSLLQVRGLLDHAPGGALLQKLGRHPDRVAKLEALYLARVVLLFAVHTQP